MPTCCVNDIYTDLLFLYSFDDGFGDEIDNGEGEDTHDDNAQFVAIGIDKFFLTASDIT